MIKDEILKRLKSKVVWMGIISYVLPILGHIGLYEKIGITQDQVKYIVDIFIGLLVTFGLLNNPKDSKNF